MNVSNINPSQPLSPHDVFIKELSPQKQLTTIQQQLVEEIFNKLASYGGNPSKAIEVFKEKGGFELLNKGLQTEDLSSIQSELDAKLLAVKNTILKPTPKRQRSELEDKLAPFHSTLMQELEMDNIGKPQGSTSTSSLNQVYFLEGKAVLKFPANISISSAQIDQIQATILAAAKLKADSQEGVSACLEEFEKNNQSWMSTLHPSLKLAILDSLKSAIYAVRGNVSEDIFLTNARINFNLYQAFSSVEKHKLLDREIFAHQFDQALGFDLNVITERYVTPSQEIGIVQPFKPMIMGEKIFEGFLELELEEDQEAILRATSWIDKEHIQKTIFNRVVLADGDFHSGNLGFYGTINDIERPELVQIGKWDAEQIRLFLSNLQELVNLAEKSPDEALKKAAEEPFGEHVLDLLKSLNTAHPEEALKDLKNLKFKIVLFDNDHTMPRSNTERILGTLSSPADLSSQPNYTIPTSFRCILLALPQADEPIPVELLKKINEKLNPSNLVNLAKRRFSDQELQAFLERTQRAKHVLEEAIQNKEALTPRELVKRVMPEFDAYDQKCQQATQKSKHGTLAYLPYKFYRYLNMGMPDRHSMYSEVEEALKQVSKP